MKGLILKDIYSMKGMGKSMLFLFIIFCLAFKDQGMAVMVTMFTVATTVLVINSLALDEMHNWYRIALTMPVSRHQLVLSKYLISVIYALVGIIAGICSSLLMQAAGWSAAEASLVGVIAIASVAFLMALLFISLLLPVNLKFGVQKSRLLLLALVALPVLAVTVLTSIGIVFPVMFYFGVNLSSHAIVFISIAVVAVLITGSYLLSVRILKKKEF